MSCNRDGTTCRYGSRGDGDSWWVSCKNGEGPIALMASDSTVGSLEAADAILAVDLASGDGPGETLLKRARAIGRHSTNCYA